MVFETAAYCAVNCYAMITGYVYMGKKCRLSSLGMIWLQTFVYSLGIAVCVWVLKPELFTWEQLRYFMFPVTNKGYWYVSAYAGLFIMIPLLNAGMEQLTQEQTEKMLWLGFVLFSVMPTINSKDAFGMGVGYSTFWLCLMYLAGASIKRYGWGSRLTTAKTMMIYLCCITISWGWKMIKESVTGARDETVWMIQYTSPTMVMAAAALFMTFLKIKVSSGVEKVILRFAPAAFGVYLIHEHDCVKGHFIKDGFAFLASKNVGVMILGVIGSAFAIFLLCILVDYVRHRVFEKLHIKQYLLMQEDKIAQVFASTESPTS